MTDLTDREALIKLSTQLDNLLVVVSETREDVKELNRKVELLEDKIRKDFVTKSEFEPVKRLVYGATGIILTSVVIAIVALITGVGGLP